MKYRALLLLITVALISAFLSLNLHSQKPPRTYVGSAACGDCHVPIYQRWAKTRMANVVTEWNVGCERCHGPGSDHAGNPSRLNIVNPAKLDFVRATDTCIQCHSQGQPLNNPINSLFYDWPVGFHQGLNLKDFWRLEEHKLGETNFMHFADGTGHKNRMQGNDFVQSVM